MDAKQFKALIETLEHIRKRPGMYFTDDMASIDNFISGFYTAMTIFVNQDDSNQAFARLLHEKGLQPHKSIYQQLKAKGYNDTDAVHEYLGLLIESRKQLAE